MSGDRSLNLRSKAKVTLEDLTDDLKNDLKGAFDMFKSQKGKLDKLGLRTILYSFVLYKSSPKDINEFINELFGKQNDFSYDDLCKCVYHKIKLAREKESDDLCTFITYDKFQTTVSKSELEKAYENIGMEVSQREISELLLFIANDQMTEHKDKNFNRKVDTVTKDEIKYFYTNNK